MIYKTAQSTSTTASKTSVAGSPKRTISRIIGLHDRRELGYQRCDAPRAIVVQGAEGSEEETVLTELSHGGALRGLAHTERELRDLERRGTLSISQPAAAKQSAANATLWEPRQQSPAGATRTKKTWSESVTLIRNFSSDVSISSPSFHPLLPGTARWMEIRSFTKSVQWQRILKAPPANP